MELSSKNLSFLFDLAFVDGQQQVVDDLWRKLMKHAVEPGQASPPFLPIFADECLICAVIMKKSGMQDIVCSQPREQSKEQPSESSPAPRGRRRRRGGRGQQGAATVAAPTIPERTSYNTTIGGNANASATSPAPVHSDWPRLIGLIYLHANPSNPSREEANIGVIICNGSQKKGYAREAVEVVLRFAFEEFHFHRVQAAILDTPEMDRPLRLFIGLGFAHEGTRRRSVFQPEVEGNGGTWKDVTYVAMLDTDWVMRNAARRGDAPITLWSEMLSRQTREREQILKWEEKYKKLTKSASTETLREATTSARPSLAEEIHRAFQTEMTETSISSCQTSTYGSAPPSPGPRIYVDLADGGVVEMADAASNLGSEWGTDQENARRMDASNFDLCRNWLEASSARRLALPSIPSTRGSEAYPETPVTIPSPSSPGQALPPSSPESEDEVSSWGSSPRPRVHLPVTNRSSTATVKNTSSRVSMRPRASSKSSVSSYSSLSSFNSSTANSVGNGGDWDVVSAPSSGASSSRPRW